MKRMQLFEFEDLSWCPEIFRIWLTNYLRSLHGILRTPSLVAPLVKRCLEATGTRSIVDLCSGSGGPIPEVSDLLSKELGVPVKTTLTDLYPNKHAIDRIANENRPHINYRDTPVNAGSVPSELDGVRTMICSFHHMPPPVASMILKDCFQKRKAICVFEISDNSAPKLLWWTAFPIGFVITLLLTPFTRPLSLGHLLLTYLVPIMPILIAWDGAASNARTYTKADLNALIDQEGLRDPRYLWEIDTLESSRVPGRMLYLLGIPLS